MRGLVLSASREPANPGQMSLESGVLFLLKGLIWSDGGNLLSPSTQLRSSLVRLPYTVTAAALRLHGEGRAAGECWASVPWKEDTLSQSLQSGCEQTLELVRV